MAIYLSEADVREILTMELALKAVEDSFLMLADGSALNIRAPAAASRSQIPISITWPQQIRANTTWA